MTGKSLISDTEIEDFLVNNELNFTITSDKQLAYQSADFIIIATPTDYNPETSYLNTRSVEVIVADLPSINPKL